MNTLTSIMQAKANTAFLGATVFMHSPKYKRDTICHLVILKRDKATWEDKPFVVTNYNANGNFFANSSYDLTQAQAIDEYRLTLKALGTL